MRIVLDERDLRAHPPEELRELHTDRTTPENDEARRDRAHPDRLAVRPVLDVREPVDRRDGRFGAGRDDELVIVELALAHRDDTGAQDARLSAHELGALLREPLGMPCVVAPVRHLVAPPEDALDVDLPGHRLSRAGSQPCSSERLGRSQERLRRQARVVRALTSRELMLRDHDLGVGVEPTQRAHEVLAARPGAEHDHALTSHQTERAGFEPATHLSARTRFPVALLRPLGHLSKTRQPSQDPQVPAAAETYVATSWICSSLSVSAKDGMGLAPFVTRSTASSTDGFVASRFGPMVPVAPASASV